MWKQKSAHSLPTLVLAKAGACCGLVSRLEGCCFCRRLRQRPTQMVTHQDSLGVGVEAGDRLWKGQRAVAAKDSQQESSNLRFLKHNPQGLAACLS